MELEGKAPIEGPWVDRGSLMSGQLSYDRSERVG